MRHQRAFPARADQRPCARRRRPLPVARGRRVSPVQPGDDPQAAVRRAARTTINVFKEYSEAGRRPVEDGSARCAACSTSSSPEADADRGSRVGRSDREALQDRRDVVWLHQQGGPRDAGDRHEPHRRQEQHRRGRRGPGPLPAACRTATRRTAPSSRSPRAASASPAITWSTRASCRSRWPRAPSPARAASCPAQGLSVDRQGRATRRRASA